MADKKQVLELRDEMANGQSEREPTDAEMAVEIREQLDEGDKSLIYFMPKAEKARYLKGSERTKQRVVKAAREKRAAHAARSLAWYHALPDEKKAERNARRRERKAEASNE